jgi:hypothetical protein
MRIVARLLWPVTIFAVMLSGCRSHEDETYVFTVVLSANVQQLVDNGYLDGAGDEILYPVDPVDPPLDPFYFAATPEMLDTLFEFYPAVLDSLFPDGGSLLILDLQTVVEDEVLGYSMEAISDTVRIWVEVRHWDYGTAPYPGMWQWVFPVGVVLEPETPTE